MSNTDICEVDKEFLLSLIIVRQNCMFKSLDIGANLSMCSNGQPLFHFFLCELEEREIEISVEISNYI